MSDSGNGENLLSSGMIAIEIARKRSTASMIDAATPYLGIVEGVKADGTAVLVRRADEAPGVGRWVGRQAGARPAIGATIPILPITGMNARGELESVPLAMPPIGADVTGGQVIDGILGVINSAGPAGIEFGRAAAGDTPYIDFHAQGGNTDYDVRIIATGGNPSLGGLGILNILSSYIYRYGEVVWDDASAAGRVLTGHLADRQVTTGKIALEGVTVNELGASSVTNPKLATWAVTGDKILDYTIPPWKLDRAYSEAGHLHDERYAGVGHLHDNRYSILGHLHAYLLLSGGTVSGGVGFAGGIDVAGMTHSGGAGFFGAAPVGQRGAPAFVAQDGSATSATLATAINTLRAGLIQLGLFG